jgi:hypothetical protein
MDDAMNEKASKPTELRMANLGLHIAHIMLISPYGSKTLADCNLCLFYGLTHG